MKSCGKELSRCHQHQTNKFYPLVSLNGAALVLLIAFRSQLKTQKLCPFRNLARDKLLNCIGVTYIFCESSDESNDSSSLFKTYYSGLTSIQFPWTDLQELTILSCFIRIEMVWNGYCITRLLKYLIKKKKTL